MIAFMNLELRLPPRATVDCDCYSITNLGWTLEKILRPIPLFPQINEEFIDENGAFWLVEHRVGYSLRIRNRFKFNMKYFFLS